MTHGGPETGCWKRTLATLQRYIPNRASRQTSGEIHQRIPKGRASRGRIESQKGGKKGLKPEPVGRRVEPNGIGMLEWMRPKHPGSPLAITGNISSRPFVQ